MNGTFASHHVNNTFASQFHEQNIWLSSLWHYPEIQVHLSFPGQHHRNTFQPRVSFTHERLRPVMTSCAGYPLRLIASTMLSNSNQARVYVHICSHFRIRRHAAESTFYMCYYTKSCVHVPLQNATKTKCLIVDYYTVSHCTCKCFAVWQHVDEWHQPAQNGPL